MKYKIKRGRKSSFPPLPLLAIGKKKTLQWKVTFNESAIYEFGNQSDIQKLVGIGWFPGHHKNSARFGWRWRPDKKQVEVLAYCYDKGVRLSSASTEKSIALLELNREYILRLDITDKTYVFNIYDESSGQKIHLDLVFLQKTYKSPWIGFYLKPYFEADGKQGAPHDMIFNITKQ